MMQFFNRTRLSHSSSITWFALLLLMLCTKVLWGHWTRDLTIGDTAYYFDMAMAWAHSHEVDIVWSPLYTAYYGSWWSLLEDAVSATFAHRLMLILVSTALVAWLALLTLPRLLALVLVVWWVALPIHYEALYEVHLFGALPLILMGVVAFAAPARWRYPLWLGLAVVTVLLVRNEYVIILVVLAGFLGALMITGGSKTSSTIDGRVFLRCGLVLGVAVALVAGFYAMSVVKGSAIAAASNPKHTLNMCQVYAFGYQQRHPEWTASPWTECYGLMEETFGERLPTLGKMVVSNPRAVLEHFWWNLSLAPAGFELLLFNVAGSENYPSYPPVAVNPILPRIAFLVFAMVGIFGLYRVMAGQRPEYLAARCSIVIAAPILVGGALMAIAIILTQHPRPTYLLGFCVLLAWLWLVIVGALLPGLKRFDHSLLPLIILAALVIAVPSYGSLQMQNKSGYLSLLYSEAKPHAESLCSAGGMLGLNDYFEELPRYLCAPYLAQIRENGQNNDLPTIQAFSLADLAGDSSTSPNRFVLELDQRKVTAVIIDPWLIQKNPGLQSCEALRDAFLLSGWELLEYRSLDDDRCVAIYRRELRH